jgi:type IV secretory pathway TrbD component
MKRFLERWWFGLALLAGYTAVFSAWEGASRADVLRSGLAASAVLTALLLWAAGNGYFANLWDMLWHAVVIADLAAEAVLVRHHSGQGHLLCAAAFALVAGGYHALRTRAVAGRPDRI